MGCGASKLEAEDELPAGLRPIRRKIEEVKRRRRRTRRYSIVSTTELLRPEDDRDGAAADAEGSSRKVKASAVAPEPEPEEEEEEEKAKFEAVAEEAEEKEEEDEEEEKEEEEEEAMKVEKGRRIAGKGQDDEEEMPGSPSFRFYFIDAVRDSDDDSVKLAGFQRKEKLEEIKEKDNEREDAAEELVNSNEDSESKQLKKEKPKKLRALTKAPSAVRHLFNVRSCYSNPSSDTNHESHPRLLTGTSA